MSPEDRLDALLSAMRHSAGGLKPDAQAAPMSVTEHPDSLNSSGSTKDAAALAPLLESARRVAKLGTVRPSAAFAQALEMRILARAAERSRAMVAQPVARGGRTRRFDRSSGRMFRLALVAAVLLVVLGFGALTAAAAAGPGNPLFGLHRLEQSLRVGLAARSADRAHQHLQLAREWLGAVRMAAEQHRGDPTYSDALTALRDEDAAAAREISQMPSGAERDTLKAELDALHANEQATLQGVLAVIDWPDRVMTTLAIGGLGVSVPRVTSATLDASHDGIWRITLTGTGFEQGAMLLADGRSAGTVISLSAEFLVADLQVRGGLPAALGVGNPDGTAAATGHITVVTARSATPTPDDQEGTPTPDDEVIPATTPGDAGDQATPAPSPSVDGG